MDSDCDMPHASGPGLQDFDDAINDAVADLSASGARLLAEIERLKVKLRRVQMMLNSGVIALESLDDMGERVMVLHKGVDLRSAIARGIEMEGGRNG